MGSGTIYRGEFKKRGEAVAVDVPGQSTFDDGELMLQAVSAGEGLAYLSDIGTAEAIEAGPFLPALEDRSAEYPCPVARVHRFNSPAGDMKRLLVARDPPLRRD